MENTMDRLMEKYLVTEVFVDTDDDSGGEPSMGYSGVIANGMADFDDNKFNQDIRKECKEYLALIKGKRLLSIARKKDGTFYGKEKGKKLTCFVDEAQAAKKGEAFYVFPIGTDNIGLGEFNIAYRTGKVSYPCDSYYFVVAAEHVEWNTKTQKIKTYF